MKIKNIKICSCSNCYVDPYNIMSILYIPNGPNRIADFNVLGDWHNQIKTIFISDTIQFIEYGTFSNGKYNNVKNLILGKNVKKIGMDAFKNTKIRKIVFPESIEYIYLSAFSNCKYLESIDFSKAINYDPIATDIFDGCSRLKEMKLTDELKNKIKQNLRVYRVFNVGHLKENYPEIFGDKK